MHSKGKWVDSRLDILFKLEFVREILDFNIASGIRLMNEAAVPGEGDGSPSIPHEHFFKKFVAAFKKKCITVAGVGFDLQDRPGGNLDKSSLKIALGHVDQEFLMDD